MILGFTGSQTVPGMDGLSHLFNSLQGLDAKHQPETIVVGACTGYDAEIQMWFRLARPGIRRIVVVPANRGKVDPRCLQDSEASFIYMPDGTSYRDRNTKLVELSDHMAGFWTGKTAYSGTWMTLNIANRAGKLQIEDIFGVAPMTDEEVQYLYYNGPL
jgi:hypothetical protein